MSAYRQVDATVSAHRAPAVTPSDSTVLETTRSLYVGTGGDIKVTMTDSTDASPSIFYSVNSGAILPIQVTKVWATGTTASNILALY